MSQRESDSHSQIGGSESEGRERREAGGIECVRLDIQGVLMIGRGNLRNVHDEENEDGRAEANVDGALGGGLA